MHLEHLNLVVNDLEETLVFYQAAFPHWRVRGGGESIWHGTPRRWLHFGDDYHYLSLNDSGTGEVRDLKSNAIGLAHFAYVVDNIEALILRLAKVGYEVAIMGALNEAYMSRYFIDPNGFEVEFVEYLTDIPTERNQYDE
ncbi:VOC family protein [Shewanella phaeophyticola]|uniref:VOC family protein n=1 Tax=Shewanella phaeophyticola TaxID=2978345 RepID=A0ABT2P6M7_9GAMM|nr:VOC family protein [Shewanella sp. KJ10-1]MCT8986891.1 VOC family protein [Shewanella sp. KJ10-1]